MCLRPATRAISGFRTVVNGPITLRTSADGGTTSVAESGFILISFRACHAGGTTMASNPVGGHAIVLAFAERQLTAILLLTMKAGVITTINVLADPERIGSLGSQLKEVP
jgi:hypothetical protein